MLNSPIPILTIRRFQQKYLPRNDSEFRNVVIVLRDSSEVIRLQFDSSQRFADFSDAAPVKVYGIPYRDKLNRLCLRVEKMENV